MQTYNYIKSNYNNKNIVAIKTVEVAPAVSKVKEKCYFAQLHILCIDHIISIF